MGWLDRLSRKKDHGGRLTERQVELDEKGALEAIIIGADPILADGQQRQWYGVDKPSPPA